MYSEKKMVMKLKIDYTLAGSPVHPVPSALLTVPTGTVTLSEFLLDVSGAQVSDMAQVENFPPGV